jgi:hypothetical protein
MRSATALATVVPFGIDEDDPRHAVQVPLPFPAVSPVLPAPVERGPRAAQPLRERASRFVQAVVEVLAGERPARQLAAWLSPEVYRALQQRLTVAASARPSRARSSARVVSVHVAMVDDHVAEIAGRMVQRGRSRAIAVRLELVRDHRDQESWRCTALEWA